MLASGLCLFNCGLHPQSPLNKTQHAKAKEHHGTGSEEPPFSEATSDESSTTIEAIIKSIAGSNISTTEHGIGDGGKDSDYEGKYIGVPNPAADETIQEAEPEEHGHGKWKKKHNPLCENSAWWKED
jgi:hypothetical protein